MSRTGLPAGSGGRERRDLLNPALGALALIALGIAIGIQYLTPNSRVIAVLVAMVLFGFAWRLDLLAGVGLLVMALPYPRATVFGSTNLALILLLLVIWLLRITQRQSPAPRRTPLDAPIAAFSITWILSFQAIHDSAHLAFAFQNSQLMVAGILIFYLITSNTRTDADLRRLHGFQILSLVTICLLGLYELANPGGALIPGWIEFARGAGDDFGRHNVRVGGPFFDYELLAEFAAISLLLVTFWIVRASNARNRVLLFGVLLLDIFILFATVTRGAMISLGVALLYLAWLMRRHIRVVPFTLLVTGIVGGFLAMNFYVANFTRSGDVLARLMGTEVKGFVPDSRVLAWQDGWDRMMLSPIIGHGPYYAPQIGTHSYYWPHNGYLYIANLVGLVGLACFLWILWMLWRITRPDTDRLDGPDYPRSYQVIAHVQLLLFIIDQTKIDFLRNSIYQFQVWLYFSVWTAGYLVATRSPSAPRPSLGR